jgi:hypothetical protein
LPEGERVDVFKGVVKLIKRDRERAVREIARIDAALTALGLRSRLTASHNVCHCP